jgi:hypothetical protein
MTSAVVAIEHLGRSAPCIKDEEELENAEKNA